MYEKKLKKKRLRIEKLRSRFTIVDPPRGQFLLLYP